MDTTIQRLKKHPVGSSRFANLRLRKNQILPDKTRRLPDVVAIHVLPKTLLAGASNGGNCHVLGTHRMRLEGGPYMAILAVEIGGKLHFSIFNPGSKEFAHCVRRINSRGYVRFCVYDLLGRFFIFRSEFPKGLFFESAMEVHEASRGVSQEVFMQAVSLFDSCLKHDGLHDLDWSPSDRAKISTTLSCKSTNGEGV